MKKLSKVLSVICALVLVASLGVTAFAAYLPNVDGSAADTLNPEDPNTDTELKLTVKEGTAAAKYCVEIDYTSLVFTYTKTAPVYSPKDHKLTAGEGEGKWDNDGKATVTLKNHSNADVFAKVDLVDTNGSDEYTPASHQNVNLALSGDGYTALNNGKTAIPGEDTGSLVVGGVGGEHDVSNDKVITITATGEPSNTVAEDVIAKLKVTLSTTSIGA